MYLCSSNFGFSGEWEGSSFFSCCTKQPRGMEHALEKANGLLEAGTADLEAFMLELSDNAVDNDEQAEG